MTQVQTYPITPMDLSRDRARNRKFRAVTKRPWIGRNNGMQRRVSHLRVAGVVAWLAFLTACTEGSPGPAPAVTGSPPTTGALSPSNPAAALQTKSPTHPKTAHRSRHRQQAKASAKAHRKPASLAERHTPKHDTTPEVIPLD